MMQRVPTTPAAASVAAAASGKSAAMALPTQIHRGVERRPSKVAAAASSSSEIILPNKYCESVFKTVRRPTRTINIGNVKVGSEHPVRLQTMTTTDTRNVAATVEQVKRCVDAGAELVRITVQGRKEAQACGEIREALFKDNYSVPLVADIHFQPQVAMMVADAFEKIRINPGNFADGRKTFEEINYDDPAQFAAEQESIRETFTPLVEKCKSLGRAMRIGTNHGSLSARILSYYGDTPRGMVESAFEFADICRDMDYHNFLFSMKASNPLVMVQAYRLLSEEMYSKGWDYPLHLGVTEAGEGEDGRMKSAIGIGSLLMDGLGDTLRVSLTEDPDLEMAPARTLERLGVAALGKGIPDFGERHRDTRTFTRRVGRLPEQRDGDAVDFRPLLHRDGSVLSAVSVASGDLSAGKAEATYRALGAKLVVGMPFKDLATSDSIVLDGVPLDADAARAVARLQEVGVGVIVPADKLESAAAASTSSPSAPTISNCVALYKLASIAKDGKLSPPSPLPTGAARYAVAVDGSETDEQLAALATTAGNDCVLALLDPEAAGLSRVHASRRVFELLARSSENRDNSSENNASAGIPVVHHKRIPKGASRDELVIAAGSELGALLVDGLGDGVLLQAEDPAEHDLDYLRTTSFGLLQGSRMRNTKTEYVSCPSCGRTLFDLQEITEQIRVQTGHLPGVSIAIMGCIVNGPGEMADADFGYVGGAPGKIDLYVGKEVVRRAIPMETACDELIELIKEHGRWVEPSSEVEEEAEEEVASAVA